MENLNEKTNPEQYTKEYDLKILIEQSLDDDTFHTLNKELLTTKKQSPDFIVAKIYIRIPEKSSL
jgi:hypothetical protein